MWNSAQRPRFAPGEARAWSIFHGGLGAIAQAFEGSGAFAGRAQARPVHSHFATAANQLFAARMASTYGASLALKEMPELDVA